MDWSGQLSRVVNAFVGPLLSRGKRLWGEREAAHRPMGVVDHAETLLDEALRRLGTQDCDPTWWSQLAVDAQAALVRPEEFHKPHVRAWLSQPTVVRLLKDQARARVVGGSESTADFEHLVASYMEVSLENRQHAESALIVALAFLQASLQAAVKDPGTAGAVQAVGGEQRRRFDAVDEKLAAVLARDGSGSRSGSGPGAARADALPPSLCIPERKWDAEHSPPAALLRAEFGVVPFSGRTMELRRIREWLDRDLSVAVGLITGPGGRGKTRLAIEAARRADADAWYAGFIEESQLVPLLDTRDTTRHLLVVVDYAEDDPRHLAQALKGVYRLQRDSTHRLRILLLARNASDWWEEIQSSGREAADLTHHPDAFLRIRLAELADNDAQALPLFERAREAFRSRLRLTAPVSAAPVLPAGREALLIFAQALLLELGEVSPADAQGDVLDFLLSRERGFWHRALGRHGLQAPHWRLFEVLVTVVTLAGGTRDRRELDSLLKGFEAHFRLDTPTSEALRLVLRTVYGTGDRVEPLQPDRLGERLIATHVQPEVLALASFRETL